MSETVLALGDVTDDGFLGGRLHVLQPRRGFRAAIDSVLLPAAVEAKGGPQILDAGLGAGVASLCLLAREPRLRITGVENQKALADLAAANAERNGFALDIQYADFLVWRSDHLFDQVMTNPPYFQPGRCTGSPVKGKRLANAGPPIGAWLGACLLHLKPGGVLTLIHRGECEAEILAALDGAAGDIEILPLLPKPGDAPRRILVRARKGAARSLRRWPGFVLHGEATKYTDAAEAVLRHGARLAWGDDKAGGAP